MLKSGVVAFNGRHSTLPCTVRDLSSGGARLKIEGSINAPDTFTLIIELDGIEADCEVAWRRTNEIGVRFVAPIRQVHAMRKQVLTAVVPANRPSIRRKPFTHI